jgi:hypothetical protein
MKIIIKENLRDKLKSLDDSGKNISKLLPKTIFTALTLLEAQIKQNIRTTFTMRSGSLLNSVQKNIEIKGNEVIGSVGPEGVPYAAAQEYGATIPERFVAPRNKLSLKWEQNGKTFFSKGHKIPSFELPARPYMQPAIDKLVPIITENLNLMVEKELEKN